jgi:long-chain acyl-CoA synthetase
MTADPATVYETLVAAATRHADAVALEFEGRSLTYAELLQRVDNAARRLSTLGIGHGDIFAIYAQNCPEMLIGYYAASKLGSVLVPINPNMTAPEVAHAVSHCQAQLLLHDDLTAEAARQAAHDSPCYPLELLNEPCEGAGAAAEARFAPDDDFIIIYTSGSTGAPKAIVLTHRAQTNVLRALNRMWGINARDTTLVGLPLGYLYGLSTASASALNAGGRIVLMRRFHPGEILTAFQSSRATVYHGVPTMFSMMLDYAEQRDAAVDLSFVRALICAGAPLPEELKRRFAARFRKEIQNYYALSECTPVFGFYAEDARPMPPGAAGRLAPGAAARILDGDGNDCPDGVPGELLVKGAALIARYHKAPELTQSAFADGWFRTGDIACRDAEGFYTITGRIKDIIIRGGANIVPSEVEGVLARHPAVQDVAVFGVSDRVFGEVPVAFVVKRPGTALSLEELIGFAEGQLAAFKVPRQMAFLETLPLGKTGKVDKAALKALWQEVSNHGRR